MTSVSFTTDTLGLAIANAGTAKTRLDTLTEQASSSLIADTYGGLSRTQAATALSLQPVLAGQQAVQASISAVQGGMSVTETTLQSISTIASDFYAQIPNLNGLDASEIDSVAADARGALQQVAGLLDTQDGGVYIFAGSDGSNPPVPDPDQIGSSSFATAIGAAVAGLSANGAAATISSTLAIAGTGAGGVSPFSAAITNGTAAPPIVVSGIGQTEQVGVLAGSNGAVTSLGTSTTGSYTRDILRALATLGSLSSSQSSDSGFQTLTQDTYTSLGGAITALNQDAGVLGDRQAALTQTQTTLSNISTALTAQLSNAENVDMATTLSQLTAAQTRLQSSYQLIASLQSLSLTRYLTSGG
jgi:flagellin-like hook-associated protein FlgL